MWIKLDSFVNRYFLISSVTNYKQEKRKFERCKNIGNKCIRFSIAWVISSLQSNLFLIYEIYKNACRIIFSRRIGRRQSFRLNSNAVRRRCSEIFIPLLVGGLIELHSHFMLFRMHCSLLLQEDRFGIWNVHAVQIQLPHH